MTGVLIRSGVGEIQRDKKSPCEDGSSDWTDESVSQGMSRVASSPQYLDERLPQSLQKELALLAS